MVTTYPPRIFTTLKMDLALGLESHARDLDFSYLQYLLTKDSLGDEDKDLNLESAFPTVTQVEVEIMKLL